MAAPTTSSRDAHSDPSHDRTPDRKDDHARLAALRRYGVLDSPRQQAFDDITRLAAGICSTPVAGIHLIDGDRQFFLAELGLGIREVPIAADVVHHLLAGSELLVVDDLASDERYAFVQQFTGDRAFRFYAGALLCTPEGIAIGRLFVLDAEPRQLSDEQGDALRMLARQVMTQLELRHSLAEKEQATRALRDSEERFRATFDQTVVGIVLSDMQGRIIRANPAFCNLVGRDEAELIGHGSASYTHPDDVVLNNAQIRSVEHEVTDIAQYEKRYVRKTGETVWAQITLSTARDVQGNATNLIAVVEDITSRRAATEELTETRRRLSSALIAGEVATFEWDVLEDQLWGDANFDRFFGVMLDPDGTAPLSRFMAAIHPDDHERVGAEVARSVETGADYKTEYRIITGPETRWVTARGRVERDPSGRVVRFPGVLLDVTERKRAEQARAELAADLEWQSRIYDTILSTTDDFAYLFDLEAKFLFANRRLLEVWGKSLREAIGRGFLDLDYPQWHAEMHTREILEVIETKLALRGEVPYLAPTGIFGIYEYVFVPVVGDDGTVEAVAGTSRDITNRKRAEESLRRLSDQLRLALDSAEMGWWQYDVDAGTVYWDERLCAMYGETKERRTIGEALDLVHADDREMMKAAIAASIDPHDPQPYSVQYRLVRRDGRSRWVSSKGQAAFEGEGEHRRAVTFVGTALDITDAKSAQDVLLASEARFRELAEALPQIVWAARPDGVLEYYNDYWYAFSGARRDVMNDKAWQPYLHPDDLPGTIEVWSHSVRTGEPYEVSFRLRRHDGEFRWHIARATPVRDAEGNITRWLGTNMDIDDQKRLLERNTELLDSERTARSEAERASRMKDEFLATLSHELRTPLSAVLGWAQILSSGGPDVPDLEEGLAIIERNARAQAQIIEDLLDMSRIIAGKVRLDVQRIELADVVTAAIETVRPAATAKGVRIQTVLDPLDHPISGDPNRLQQVFWNLLSNAVKFTPRDGRVQVRLERVDSHLEVSVVDTGEGIAPEFLPYVFDRFRQADATTTRHHGGLGLGLAIVKQLVELHGGSVAVTSQGKGSGSTFAVTLPLIILHPQPSEPVERRHPERSVESTRIAEDICAQAAGIRVLVVDDEAESRALVKRFLEDCQVIVTTASSVQEALVLVREHPFDVLVSDIGMPGQDGYALIREVRALPAANGGKLPAIALTAYARPEDRVKSVMAGFQLHLVKPVEPAELIAMVVSMAGRR